MPDPTTVFFQEVICTGLQYVDFWDNRDELQMDTPLELVRDPDNKYDKFAVKVCLNGKQVGWIPRHKAELFSNLLHKKVKLLAVVNECSPGSNPAVSVLSITTYLYVHKCSEEEFVAISTLLP